LRKKIKRRLPLAILILIISQSISFAQNKLTHSPEKNGKQEAILFKASPLPKTLSHDAQFRLNTIKSDPKTGKITIITLPKHFETRNQLTFFVNQSGKIVFTRGIIT
jgi:hypothetical protein